MIVITMNENHIEATGILHFENFCCMRGYRLHKGKGKVVPVLSLTEHHAIKSYWKNGCIDPLIL
jgi:hypothetical protein